MVEMTRVGFNAIERAFAFFEQIGRLMMDFGFGGFLAHFEDKFGPTLMKLLLGWLGLVVVVAGFGLIWTTALEPILEFLKTPAQSLTVARIIGFGIATVVGIFAGNLLAYPLLKRLPNAKRLEAAMKEIDEMVEKTDAVYEQAKAIVEDGEAVKQKMRATTDDAKELAERARKAAEAYEAKVAELGALRQPPPDK
jgi:hypothetical protein